MQGAMRSPAGADTRMHQRSRCSPAGDPSPTDQRRAPRFNRTARRLRGDETGTALTEFALVLPLLLLLLLAIIDFGKAINYWIDETHVANEGVRWAVVNNNPGSRISPPLSLQQYLQQQTDTPELRGDTQGTQQTTHSAKICVAFPNPDGTSNASPKVGDAVQVTVSYKYDWLHYLTAQAGLGPSTTVVGTATMRLEASPSNYSAGCTT